MRTRCSLSAAGAGVWRPQHDIPVLVIVLLPRCGVRLTRAAPSQRLFVSAAFLVPLPVPSLHLLEPAGPCSDPRGPALCCGAPFSWATPAPKPKSGAPWMLPGGLVVCSGHRQKSSEEEQVGSCRTQHPADCCAAAVVSAKVQVSVGTP